MVVDGISVVILRVGLSHHVGLVIDGGVNREVAEVVDVGGVPLESTFVVPSGMKNGS